MNKKLILCAVVAVSILQPIAGQSADCPVPPDNGNAACADADNWCNAQPSGLALASSPTSNFAIVTAESKDGCLTSCCRLKCIADANFINRGGKFDCYCNNGRYFDSATTKCMACSKCRVNKNNNFTEITQTGTDENNKCMYNIDCGTGYTAAGGCDAGNNWTVDCKANTIAIDWNENGGGPVSNGSCTYGGDLTFPAAPVRSGYVFAGWRAADGKTYPAGTTLTGGCTETHLGAGSVSAGKSAAITAQWCGAVATNGTAVPILTAGQCRYYVICNKGFQNTMFYDHNNTTANVNSLVCAECPSGYYCPGPKLAGDASQTAVPTGCNSALGTGKYGGKCKCPIGSTSATGSQEITKCEIKGGTPAACKASGKCTKFCDNYGCFYLPKNVAYKKL
jgi:hypothetical protein